MVVSFLLVLGIPALVLILRYIITGREYPLTVRIVFLSPGVSMAALSIILILSIPQLKSLVQKLYQSNQVVPCNEIRDQSVQMRNIAIINN